MLQTLARARSRPIPAFNALNYVQWRVSADGEITNMCGGGTEMLTFDAVEQIGLNVFDVYAQMPQMLSAFHRLVAGESIKEVVLGGKRLWFMDAFPILCNGAIVGATGVSFPLEPALVVTSPEPRRRKWILEGLQTQNRTSRFRNGDVFVKVDGVPGVAFGTQLTDGEFLEAMMDLGRHVHLVQDTNPPSSAPPLPPASGFPRLVP